MVSHSHPCKMLVSYKNWEEKSGGGRGKRDWNEGGVGGRGGEMGRSDGEELGGGRGGQ